MVRVQGVARSLRLRGRSASAVLAVVSIGLAATSASALPARQVAAPVAGVLRGVAAISTDDAWAVGYTTEPIPSALIEHWNGQSWSVMDVEMPGNVSWLYAVSASSSSDVWAAGVYEEREAYHGFVEHGDGTQWSPSPIDAGAAQLVAISAAGPDDVWAASRQDVVDGVDGRAFHWDGSSWSEVDTPQIGWYIGFTGVEALSPTDAWLVGFKKAGRHTIVEHWDGANWRIVASRDEYKLESLYAVAAASRSDLWAVGLLGDQNLPPGRKGHGWASPYVGQHQLIMHSTGRTWKPVEAPSLPGRSALLGVAAAGPSRAWAVGFTGQDYKPRAIIENWDGTQWVSAGRPGLPPQRTSILYAVSASSGDDAWAVGAVNEQGDLSTVIEHWDGSHWTRLA